MLNYSTIISMRIQLNVSILFSIFSVFAKWAEYKGILKN